MKTSNRAFSGKVVWVTGSSRGIGRVIAGHLASLGASVVVHGTTPYSSRAFYEADSLEAVAREISSEHGTPVLPVHGELTDEKTVKALAGEIRARMGRIDILVNSAGGDIGSAGTSGPRAGKPADNDALFISLEDLRAVLERNLMTCILVCREVAPEMIPRKWGRILNIGSVDGLWGQEQSAIYAAAKAAVHEYTRCLALLLKPHNVRVNAVAPGDVMTPRWKASRSYDPRMAVEEGTLNRYGKPIEIARVVEFLLSDASSYITGHNQKTSGVDVFAEYLFEDVFSGQLSLGLEGTYTFEFDVDDFTDINGLVVAKGDDFVGYLNTAFNPLTPKPQLKGRLFTKYDWGAHNFTAVMNYVDEYEDARGSVNQGVNGTTIPVAILPSLKDVDSMVSYDFHWNWALMDDSLVLSLSALNLTDEDPPQVALDQNYDPSQVAELNYP